MDERIIAHAIDFRVISIDGTLRGVAILNLTLKLMYYQYNSQLVIGNTF